ncbi:unnamed protein product [Brassicogethes aeneus]|uniref:Uncharacterized protein n=1 Tax=Brassicogethes aeneus TaxID=1431903 RepID=A0A9P0BIW8_BRAAE|nr:unnamed protein product [Brassicogethes aeneus]
MVNTVCDLIVERYGLSIPTKIKEEYAKCIIEIFPNLRDPFSPKGYEIFFNPQKHDGFLAWRLKTLSRNNSEKRKIIKSSQAEPLTKQQKTEEDVQDINFETCSQVNSELLINEEDNVEVWPKEIRAILALLQILRPTARGKKCPNGNTIQIATKKLLIFKKNNVPLSDIIKENHDHKQPYLIIEGIGDSRPRGKSSPQVGKPKNNEGTFNADTPSQKTDEAATCLTKGKRRLSEDNNKQPNKQKSYRAGQKAEPHRPKGRAAPAKRRSRAGQKAEPRRPKGGAAPAKRRSRAGQKAEPRRPKGGAAPAKRRSRAGQKAEPRRPKGGAAPAKRRSRAGQKAEPRRPKGEAAPAKRQSPAGKRKSGAGQSGPAD